MFSLNIGINALGARTVDKDAYINLERRVLEYLSSSGSSSKYFNYTEHTQTTTEISRERFQSAPPPLITSFDRDLSGTVQLFCAHLDFHFERSNRDIKRNQLAKDARDDI